MGDSRGSEANAGPALVARRVRGSAAGLLEFAVAQLLRDDTTLGALPAVLERLVGTFGLRAALAFQPSAGQPATVLAAYPAGVTDPTLLAKIGALSLVQRDSRAAWGGPVELAPEDSPGAGAASLLLAYSAPVGGQCLCALALIGEAASWDEEIRSVAHAVAAIAAAQIRHDKQAQQQLTEQNVRLRKVDDARNQFLAVVSHELRTPLTSIVSFCELIRGEAESLTPEGLRFLDIIERNADRLHRLIGDLLMLDRVEAGALPLDLEDVSIPELAAEAVRSASAGAAKQGVTIVVSTGEGPPVQGDARRLTQVLDNLIANAVKFSHRNGLVRVTAGCDGQTWQIDVVDSGIGIPPAEADQLFNRFVRASNARTSGLPGVGLGLSIVKILTEMHGGRVEVHSALGLGSTFSVYLPAAAP